MTKWTNREYQKAARTLIYHAAWDLTELNPQLSRSLYAQMLQDGADRATLNLAIRTVADPW